MAYNDECVEQECRVVSSKTASIEWFDFDQYSIIPQSTQSNDDDATSFLTIYDSIGS